MLLHSAYKRPNFCPTFRPYKIQTSSELDLTLCLHHRQHYTNDAVMSVEKVEKAKHKSLDFY